MAGRSPRAMGVAAIALAAGLVLGAFLGCRRAEPEQALRIGLYAGPSTTDPHELNEFLTLMVLGHVYEPLVNLDADLRVQPALAERWDNPSELVWRFHLRPDVRFQDGRPLTADDVVATMQRVRNPGSGFASYLVAIASVRAVDPRTVEITTHRPWAPLLRKLAFVMIVPADAPAEIRTPMGTGPYRMTSWDPRRRIVLDAWDGYWGPPPPIRHVEMVPIRDERQRVDALLAGDVDLVHSVGPEAARRLQGAPGVRLAVRDGLSVEYLETNLAFPPLDDVRVRKAISLAIDRQQLVDELVGGFGLPASQVVPPMAVGFASDLPAPARDLAAARRLLAEAGFPDGVDLTLEYREGRQMEPVRRQLAEAGIRAQLVPRSWSELNERAMAGKVPLHYAALISETADASDVLDSMAHSPAPDSGWGDGNVGGYHDAELDALIERSGVALDPLVRRQTLQQCMRILDRDLPYVPLFVPHEVYGVSSELEWQPRLDGNLMAYEVRRR